MSTSDFLPKESNLNLTFPISQALEELILLIDRYQGMLLEAELLWAASHLFWKFQRLVV